MICSNCSSAKSSRASDALQNNPASSVTAASGNVLTAGEQVSSASDPNSIRKGEMRTGAYNSEISVSFDGAGNKVENRSFDNHSRISFLVVTTPVKGEPDVTVFSKNGKPRKMSFDQFNDFLTASPDVIADAAGILEPVKPVAPPLQIATKIEPVQTDNSIAATPPVQPLPEETTLVERNKIEPAAEAEKSTVQQAKQPAKESENKDNPNQF